MDQELLTIFGFNNYVSLEGSREQLPLLGNLYSITVLDQDSTHTTQAGKIR
ncbi:hypothetical protein I79_006396 [Cricetulus griseus]|uniref:Uncharacterized protein n=1 Tax=Cricetulus griseus TaxID=10029 RepID=G3H7R0_CRIGR|nr:hypothetical protein I79_006396 [Cricetulus griseus]